MKKGLQRLCIAASVLLLGQGAAYAEGSYGFLLPGEVVVTETSADVTGDGVDDLVCLIGTGNKEDGLAINVNLVVQDGQTKEVSRSFFHKVSGYGASLTASDFNGDKVKDVMLMLQQANKKLAAYVVAFNKAEPEVIYQPGGEKDDIRSGDAAITIEDNKKVVRVKKGSTIQLRLPENSSTGYTWQFTQSTGGECVVFLGQQSLIPANDPAMAGKPGLAVFSFKTVEAGTLEMRLLNYRTWEGPDNGIESFQVTVEIVE